MDARDAQLHVVEPVEAVVPEPAQVVQERVQRHALEAAETIAPVAVKAAVILVVLEHVAEAVVRDVLLLVRVDVRPIVPVPVRIPLPEVVFLAQKHACNIALRDVIISAIQHARKRALTLRH